MWRMCIFLFIAILISPVQAGEPDFKDYPVKVYTGKNHAAIITPEYRSVRTRIRNIAKDPVNFAGHYSLGWIGCGTGCGWMPIIDVKTGKLLKVIDPLPLAIDCTRDSGKEEDELEVLLAGDLKFQPDSRLLIITGHEIYTEETPDSCLIRYYLEEKGVLRPLKTVVFRPKT